MKVEIYKKKSANVNESFLIKAIEAYIERTNFPKKLVLRKLQLLNEKYIKRAEELKNSEKKAEESIGVLAKSVEDYTRKNKQLEAELKRG